MYKIYIYGLEYLILNNSLLLQLKSSHLNTLSSYFQECQICIFLADPDPGGIRGVKGKNDVMFQMILNNF